MCSRAGDKHEEELAVHPGDVIAVHSLACGMADCRAMHHGTPYWVLIALDLWHMLRKSRKVDEGNATMFLLMFVTNKTEKCLDLELLQTGMDISG